MKYLTTEEVAERFRTHASTVRYWRHVGRGPQGMRVGRRVLYAEAEVARWEREQLASQMDGTPAA
jgi:excisionase family DNA binding protein